MCEMISVVMDTMQQTKTTSTTHLRFMSNSCVTQMMGGDNYKFCACCTKWWWIVKNSLLLTVAQHTVAAAHSGSNFPNKTGCVFSAFPSSFTAREKLADMTSFPLFSLSLSLSVLVFRKHRLDSVIGSHHILADGQPDIRRQMSRHTETDKPLAHVFKRGMREWKFMSPPHI